jgi:corrinoid protein of di/trimethylamine methyltransferase
MPDKTVELRQAIIDGDEEAAKRLSEEMLAEGSDPLKTIEECVYPAVAIVGERFEKGEYFLTELMLSAEAMKAAVNVFTQKMSQGGKTGAVLNKRGVVLLGTVKGDVHEIGKNLVATMMKVNGFDIHDAGKDLSPAEFLEKADQVNADIIGLSALMTNTMLRQRETIRYIRENRGDKYKIIVGGAPTTQDWADEIGADGWAPDAPSAVTLVKRLQETSSPT